MAYHKADQLMQLATLVSSKHLGMTLDDVREEFGVDDLLVAIRTWSARLFPHPASYGLPIQ